MYRPAKLATITVALTTLGCGAGAAGDSAAPSSEGEASGSEAHPHHHHGACHEHGSAHGDFSDVECFARMFDAPERAEWQRPDEVVALLEVRPGASVVDLGAGTGYFEARLDRAVGPEGHVLALDVEAAMVEHMRARLLAEGLTRAEARLVAFDDPALPAASADRILIVDTWHHIEDRSGYAARLLAALAPGGEILVVDFTLESPEGPPVAMRLTAEACTAELASVGLITEVVAETLPYQWVVRARRP